MTTKRVLAIGLLAVWAPALAGAQMCRRGSEFQVNTYTIDDQEFPSVCSDAAGNFVVAWIGVSYDPTSGPDGDLTGIFAQRYTRNGTPTGTEFQVNTYTVDAQAFPAAACIDAGAFVVVWQSYEQDGDSYGIFAQRYDSSGQVAGTEFQVNSFTSTSQTYAAAAADGAGNFVIVWSSYDQDGSGFGIFGRRYSSTGAPFGSEFQVNTWFTGRQVYPAVARNGDGGFVVVWTSYDQDGAEGGVFGQRYDSNNQPVSTEFQVNSYTSGRQYVPSIAAADDGKFVVVWVSYNQDGYDQGIFGQRFESTGARAGTEFLVNTYTGGKEYAAEVAADAAGDFVVVWTAYTYFGPDGDLTGVFERRFDRAGAAVGNALQVNTYTDYYQSYPAISSQGAGEFVVVWQSGDRGGGGQDGQGYGIFGQRYAPLLGDCNGDCRVTTNELVVAVSIALAQLQLSNCEAIDGNRDGVVIIDELVGAIANAMAG